MGKRLERPAIRVGNVYRWRQRDGAPGLFTVAELVHKRNGWWVIGTDRKARRTVEVRPGQVFPKSTPMTEAQYGEPHRWPMV